MSEADERVWIYAVILTDTWDHLKKASNDTEMRPCTEYYMILEASEGNREQVWRDVALNNKPGSSILRPVKYINEILGCSCQQGVNIAQL